MLADESILQNLKVCILFFEFRQVKFRHEDIPVLNLLIESSRRICRCVDVVNSIFDSFQQASLLSVWQGVQSIKAVVHVFQIVASILVDTFDLFVVLQSEKSTNLIFSRSTQTLVGFDPIKAFLDVTLFRHAKLHFPSCHLGHLFSVQSGLANFAWVSAKKSALFHYLLNSLLSASRIVLDEHWIFRNGLNSFKSCCHIKIDIIHFRSVVLVC